MAPNAGSDAAFEAVVAGLFHAMYEPDDFRAGLKEALAQAWEWGYTSGHSNAMRRMSDEPKAPTSPNPYRPTPPGGQS